MATWDDVRRLAMAMPDATERDAYGNPAWRVKDKLFVWDRPLGASDFRALKDAAPQGPVLGARVADLGEKSALIERDRDIYFTTPHFDGYPAILIQLDNISVAELREVITDAWLERAPKRLAAQYLANPHR